jgi:hypothetical protein
MKPSLQLLGSVFGNHQDVSYPTAFADTLSSDEVDRLLGPLGSGAYGGSKVSLLRAGREEG